MRDDDSGVDSMPVAMVATALLVALLLALIATGLKTTQPIVSVASVDDQISKIANACRAMLTSAPRDLSDPASPPGASRLFTLRLPGDTEYVGFGFDPEGYASHEGTIYYRVHGDKRAIVVDDGVKFREGEKRGGKVVPSLRHTVLYGGTYDLTLEYAYDAAFDERYLISTG